MNELQYRYIFMGQGLVNVNEETKIVRFYADSWDIGLNKHNHFNRLFINKNGYEPRRLFITLSNIDDLPRPNIDNNHIFEYQTEKEFVGIDAMSKTLQDNPSIKTNLISLKDNSVTPIEIQLDEKVNELMYSMMKTRYDEKGAIPIIKKIILKRNTTQTDFSQNIVNSNIFNNVQIEFYNGTYLNDTDVVGAINVLKRGQAIS